MANIEKRIDELIERVKFLKESIDKFLELFEGKLCPYCYGLGKLFEDNKSEKVYSICPICKGTKQMVGQE